MRNRSTKQLIIDDCSHAQYVSKTILLVSYDQ